MTDLTQMLDRLTVDHPHAKTDLCEIQAILVESEAFAEKHPQSRSALIRLTNDLKELFTQTLPPSQARHH